MITKLIESYVAAFPMWKVSLITATIIVIVTFYLYYRERISIDVALASQFLWFVVPIFVIFAHLTPLGVERMPLEFAAHIGSGIVFGAFVAFWLYVVDICLKKFCQLVR